MFKMFSSVRVFRLNFCVYLKSVPCIL